MGIYANDVQKLYIAYFNRPADPVGLAYWEEQITKNGGSTAAVANAFSASAEYKALYDGKSSAQIVETIYQNLFGRSAEPSGLTYWAVRLENGTFNVGNIAVSILVGAQNDDKKVIDNKVVVATEFTTALDTTAEILAYSGSAAAEAARTFLKTVGATEASLTAAKSAVTSTVASIASSTVTNGQTYTLSVNTDNIVGTSNNDVINASTGLSADGSTAIATTNALDKIDGGAGVDTLVIENTGGKNTVTGTITNVENLTFVGAGNVNNNAAVDVSSFSGTITLSSTADTAVSFTEITGQTIAADKVADTTTVTAALKATQTSSSFSVTGAVGDAAINVAGAAMTSVSVSADKTATGKKITVTDTGNTTKTFNIASSGASAIEVESTATEAINVTGAGLVTLTTTTTAPTKTLSSTGSTGGVSYATELGTAVVFTGGAGKDSVAFGATTKAQTLGAGDDKATVSVTALGTGGSIDAGEGTDTLVMSAANAATADNDTTFAGTISGFDKLSITAATNQTINLANLDAINYVIEAGNGNTLTIDNMLTGGTIEFTDTSTATAIVVKDASTGTSDVINVKLTAAADFNAGTATIANVETININSDDTATSPDGTIKHTMVLTADKATKVVVSGDAQLDLTLTGSTKVTTIDASAATAGLTTNLSVASGIALTGTAKADTITLGNLSVVTGGAGTDKYTVSTPTNGNTYATITDFAVGETVQFTEANGGGTPTPATLGTKVALAATAAFADFLAAASAADGSTNSAVKWFQYGSDTYVVFDNSASTTFDNGVDQIVKLTGTLDLSKSTVSAAGLLTFVAA